MVFIWITFLILFITHLQTQLSWLC